MRKWVKICLLSWYILCFCICVVCYVHASFLLWTWHLGRKKVRDPSFSSVLALGCHSEQLELLAGFRKISVTKYGRLEAQGWTSAGPCIHCPCLAHLGGIWCGSLGVKHVRLAGLALRANLMEEVAFEMVLERLRFSGSVPDRNEHARTSGY